MKRTIRKYIAKTVGNKASKIPDRGFSTTELLLGVAITTVAVAVAGYGVSNMIGTSTASNARSDRRAELSRSLDFISAEIRESTGIEKNTATAATPASFSALGSGAKKVLMINTAATGSTPIIYYVATPAAGNWKGPRVVYRWGPAFDANGNYTNAGTPASWVSDVLIDNISNVDPASVAIGAAAPTCSNGGTYNGDSAFHACVDAAGRTAQIFQDGQVAKVLEDSENYRASTNTGARRTTVASPPTRLLPNGAIALPAWTLDNGEVKTTQPLNITMRYLGGSIVCGNPSYPIPTFGSITLKTGNANPITTNLNMSPGADTPFPSVAANTTVTVSGKAVGNSGSGGCNGDTYGPYRSTDTTQTRALKNGDDVPQTKGYLGQASIDAYLTSAATNPATGRPIVNTVTHKIDLAPNQVIYLFELGVTDTASDAFDIQDMVVLATLQ
jgi:hypothetical protein